ncbi:MAG: hypothetical protein KDD61_11285 [Bdellovibrionales bacterium]|nr:hypothetical protein [Bdellovibrionales bacterium]
MSFALLVRGMGGSMQFKNRVFILLIVAFSWHLMACSDDGSTNQTLTDASQGDDGSNDEQNDTTIPGTPIMTIYKSGSLSATRFVGGSDYIDLHVEGASSDLRYCVVDQLGDSAACDSTSSFAVMPSGGSFNSTTKVYTYNSLLMSDFADTGVKKVYFSNGSDGAISGVHHLTVGISAAVSFNGQLSDGLRVNGNFHLKSFGLEPAGAQWCAADIGTESPGKCNQADKYVDISTDGTNWSYDSVNRIFSLYLVHSELPKTTFKVRFKDKNSGVMSDDVIVVVE